MQHQDELAGSMSFLRLTGVTTHKHKGGQHKGALGARMSSSAKPMISYTTRARAEAIEKRRWGDDWMDIGQRPPSPARKPAGQPERPVPPPRQRPPDRVQRVRSPVEAAAIVVPPVLRTARTAEGMAALLESLCYHPPSSLAAVVAGQPFEAHRIQVMIDSHIPASPHDWTRRKCQRCAFACVDAREGISVTPQPGSTRHQGVSDMRAQAALELALRPRRARSLGHEAVPTRLHRPPCGTSSVLSTVLKQQRYLLGGFAPCNFRSAHHAEDAKALDDLIATLTACASSPSGAVSVIVTREPDGGPIWACAGAGSIVQALNGS